MFARFNWSSLAPSVSSGPETNEGSFNRDTASGKSGTIYGTNYSIQTGSDVESFSRQHSGMIANDGTSSSRRSEFDFTGGIHQEASTHSGNTNIFRNTETKDDGHDDLGDDFWDRYDLPPKKFKEKFLSSSPFEGQWNQRVTEGGQGEDGSSKKPHVKSVANKLGSIFRQSIAHPTEEAATQARSLSAGGDPDSFDDDTDDEGLYRGRARA